MRPAEENLRHRSLASAYERRDSHRKKAIARGSIRSQRKGATEHELSMSHPPHGRDTPARSGSTSCSYLEHTAQARCLKRPSLRCVQS